MTKLVINRSSGGFGLSAKAAARLAVLRGKTPYFFRVDTPNDDPNAVPTLVRVDEEQAFSEGAVRTTLVYTVDNPPPLPSRVEFFLMGSEARKEFLAAQHAVLAAPGSGWADVSSRSDPHLLQIIEEIGTEAAGGYLTSLQVVEIPDGVQVILDHDGEGEVLRELHRIWPAK